MVGRSPAERHGRAFARRAAWSGVRPQSGMVGRSPAERHDRAFARRAADGDAPMAGGNPTDDRSGVAGRFSSGRQDVFGGLLRF
jgi:hypothetical protein